MRNAALLCFFSLTSVTLTAPAETHWMLQAPTVKPATAPSGWSYAAISTTVRHTLAEGREVELGWTRLPPDITSEGFFITLLARAKSKQASRTVGAIALAASGFIYDKTPGAL